MPGLRRSNMPRSDWAHSPHLLSLCSRAHVLQSEKWPRWEACAQQLEFRPHSLQLEKAWAQQGRPNTCKNEWIKSTGGEESRPAPLSEMQGRAGLGILYKNQVGNKASQLLTDDYMSSLSQSSCGCCKAGAMRRRCYSFSCKFSRYSYVSAIIPGEKLCQDRSRIPWECRE